MSRQEQNKTYIREHVQEKDRQLFFEYFSRLHDHQSFQLWQLQRVVEVVSDFQKQAGSSTSKSKQPVGTAEPHSQDSIQTKIKENIQRPQKTQAFLTSLNLLKQIQESKFINCNKGDFKGNHSQANFSQLPSFILNTQKQSTKNNEELFNSFEELVVRGKDLKKISTENLFAITLQITNQGKEIQLKQSQQLKGSPNQSFRKEEADKLFKWKFSRKIKCKKLQVSLKCDGVDISSHQMVHRIFLPDYAIYLMQVYPTGIICKRTYDDFVEFRSILNNLYPGVKIPYLQSSSWLGESDILLINKNKRQLSMFMNGVLEHPILSKTSIFAQFITITDHKVLKKKYENYEKFSKEYCISDFENEMGELDISLSEQQYHKVEQLPKWSKFIEQYFEKYLDLTANLTTRYEAVQQTFSQLKNLSAEAQVKLKQLRKQAQSQAEMERQQSFQDFFRGQEIYFEDRKRQTQQYIFNFNQIYIPLVRYEKLNLGKFVPFYEEVANLTGKFIKRLENEPQSPSSVDDHKQSTRMQFMKGIWEESEHITTFFYQIAYLNTQLLKESQIFNNRLINSMKRKWLELFSKPQYKAGKQSDQSMYIVS